MAHFAPLAAGRDEQNYNEVEEIFQRYENSH